MAKREQPIVELRFNGRRFANHTIDADALVEITRFQEMVRQTARALWEQRNPGKPPPENLDACTRLCVQISDNGSGSVVASLFRGDAMIHADEISQISFLKEPDETDEVLLETVRFIHKAFKDINKNRALSDKFPRQLLQFYSRWGSALHEVETLEFSPRDETMEPVTGEMRKILSDCMGRVHCNPVNVTGEVLEADVRNKTFQLWFDETSHAIVEFTEEHEEDVTAALKNYNSMRLRVKGKGEFDLQGVLQRITEVSYLCLIPARGPELRTPGISIEDEIAEIMKDVPDEVLDQLPRDLSHRHDFYLYGDEE